MQVMRGLAFLILTFSSFSSSASNCIFGSCDNGLGVERGSKRNLDSNYYAGDFSEGRQTGCGTIIRGGKAFFYFGSVKDGEAHGLGYSVRGARLTSGRWEKGRLKEVIPFNELALCSSNLEE